MKNIKTYFLFCSLCMLLYAFTGKTYYAGDVIREIKTCYKETWEKQQKASDAGKVCYLKYLVKTTVDKQSPVPASETTIEAWTCKKMMEIKSKDMEVYQDEKESLIIMPVKKLIVRNDAVMKEKGFDSKISFIHDTILSHCTVVKEEKTNGGKKKNIELDVNKTGEQLSNIDRLEYVVDVAEKKIEKLVIHYKKGSGSFSNSFSSVSYTFLDMDFNCTNRKLGFNISDGFIKKKKQANTAYANFKVIDNRAGIKRKTKVPVN